MTIATPRWFSLLLLCILLSGCSLPAALNIPAPGETKLFEQGLDQYISTGELTTLKELPEQYPQGKWHSTVENIIAMSARDQELRLKKDKDLDICEQEKDSLVQENKILEATLNQLKEVLINTELQSK